MIEVTLPVMCMNGILWANEKKKKRYFTTNWENPNILSDMNLHMGLCAVNQQAKPKPV